MVRQADAAGEGGGDEDGAGLPLKKKQSTDGGMPGGCNGQRKGTIRTGGGSNDDDDDNH